MLRISRTSPLPPRTDCIFSNLFNIEMEKNRSALKQYILHNPTGILFSLGALASGSTFTRIYRYHMCLLYVFHSFYICFHFIRKPIVNMNLKTNSTTTPTTSEKNVENKLPPKAVESCKKRYSSRRIMMIF